MPRFLLFCHRFFELRFITATHIIENLAAQGHVTVMMPAKMAESFKSHLPEGVDIAIAEYDKAITGKRAAMLNMLGDILYLTFPNTHILQNRTAAFHQKYYTPSRAYMKPVVVGVARAASKSRLILNAVRWMYQKLLPATAHQELIRNIKPDLMIGCSFGLGSEDACFLAEARQNHIKSAVILQTWDRSSNKGYPTIHPDYALVWNEVMKRECMTHLDFTENQVIITGSPLWDTHFKKIETPPDPNWRANLRIAPDAKVIFFACGEFRSHPANMGSIPQIFNLALHQPFKDKVHIVFRLYPYYLSPAAQKGKGKVKKDELEALLARYKDHPAISILYPDFIFDGENFIPAPGDHDYMTECLRQCDISVSMVSSQMIEGCIFDKPAMNIEYGLREAEKYVIELADYRPEHLIRIYESGAIYRIQSASDIESYIARALENPGEKAAERSALIAREAPVNRGRASMDTAEKLRMMASGLI